MLSIKPCFCQLIYIKDLTAYHGNIFQPFSNTMGFGPIFLILKINYYCYYYYCYCFHCCFVLAIKLLANAIKQNPNIIGIQCSREKHKHSSLMIFSCLQSPQSQHFQTSLNSLQSFHISQTNSEKLEILNKSIFVTKYDKYSKDKFYVLVVY